MTYSAKARLLADKATANKHMDAVSSEAFLRGAEAALLEMVMQAPDESPELDASAHYHQIIGARNYLKRLLAIAELPQTPTPKPQYGLNREG